MEQKNESECGAEVCPTCCMKIFGDCNGVAPDEPSTEVLVSELRRANKIYMLESGILDMSACRLESLQREIESLKFSNEEAVKLINRRAEIITELTARAENAEMQIVDFSLDCGTMTETIAALRDELSEISGRLEKAEAERDAVYDMLQDMRGCDECKHLARTWKEEPCNCCCKDYSMFEPSSLQPHDA